MNSMIKALKYIFDKKYRYQINSSMHKYDYLSDREYLEKRFLYKLGKKLNLDDPVTFNEKIQWLKLYDRKPEYSIYADKYHVRQHVADTIGEEYLVPLLGVWDDPNEIDFDALPDRFVLKCNHNSGLGMYICTDKSKMNVVKVKKDLRKGLDENYYLTGREWPYKDIPRKIIAEQYLSDGSGDLADYKVFNFNGVPKVILVCKDRFAVTGMTEDFFSADWKHLDLKRKKYPNSSNQVPEPEKLDEILSLSQKLSENIPFMRTDFYIVNDKIYFGEMTFFPASGFEPFVPEEWDKTLGDWLELPEQNNNAE